MTLLKTEGIVISRHSGGCVGQKGRNRNRHRLAYVFWRDGGRCQRCNVECSLSFAEVFNQATVDHIVPRSKGGTNASVNLQLLCRPCNLRKGSSQ